MAHRLFRRSIFQKNKKPTRLELFLEIAIGLILLVIFLFSFAFLIFAKDLPRPESFTERPFILPTKIYDRTGQTLLYQIYGEERRTVVPLSQIPDVMKNAVIATEDADFYNHFGLDLRGILRSILNNLRIGNLTYGGSTISQQLIRSSFLTMEKTATRKIKEIVLTLELERRYNKDQILGFYLNQVPFGSNAYGVEAASQTFFDKSVENLSLAEAATLASLIQAPSRLSPYGSNMESLLARKDYVLSRMVQENYISEEEAQKAKEEVIKFAAIKQDIKAPHFVLYIRQYLEENYPDYFLQEQGLKVYTSLDWELQQKAEKIVQDSVELRNRSLDAYNAGLVAINPNNGEILAMVGSANWNDTASLPEGCTPGLDCLYEPKVNVAVYGEGRQPGSAFKPFAYAKAFSIGYTPETVLWDTLTEFNPNCSEDATEEKDEYDMDCYHPFNYDERFRGPISLRNALAQSINVPSVKLLYLAGVMETINLAKSFGITTLNQPNSWYGLSLVLGGGEVRLLDITSAYGVFATRGYSVPPVSILRIEDGQGNIIEENTKSPKRVLSNQVADLINDILSDNVARTPIFGANSWLYTPEYETAVKTGTTQGYKDAWTIGYTPNIVVGVWAGNNDGTPANKRPGADLAGPIWHNFIDAASAKYPPQDFTKPEPNSADKPILKGEIDRQNPHEILYYINKSDPLGESPQDPTQDPQYLYWEAALQKWLTEHPLY